MPPVRFGLGFQSDKSAAEYARLGVAAEALGFDVLSVFGDLMYQPPIFPLLTMAAHTSRVTLGPACLNPYSVHPYEIAGQVAALDLASHGRAYLGLARGSWLGEVGLDQPRPLAHLQEAAAVVARLLAGDDRGYDGTVFRLSPGAALRYRPQRASVPLLLGAWGPRTTRLAGRLAAEIKVGGTANPLLVPHVRRSLDEGAREAGRPAGGTTITVGAVTVVDEDGRAARALARREVAMYLAVVAELDPTLAVDPELLDRVRAAVDAGDHAAAGALIPGDLLDRFAFSGTPDQVAEHAARLVDAGVERIEFGTPHGLTDLGGVELLGRRVLPAFADADEDLAERRAPQVSGPGQPG
jgi:5,10-methylenetetrahydromethanopterin reductase